MVSFISVEARHATVNMLFLIYGRLDERALRVGKPISFSARCQAFYSSIRKVHDHSIVNCLSIISSALVVRVVQRATLMKFILVVTVVMILMASPLLASMRMTALNSTQEYEKKNNK